MYVEKDNKWVSKANMPTKRGALALGVIDNKIYAVGGVGWNKKNTIVTEVYDPQTDKWNILSRIITPRDHLAVGVHKNKLYAVAGRINGNYGINLGINEVYDPKEDSWSRKTAIPTYRSGISAVTLKNKIYVFGGESKKKTFDENERFDPITERKDC